MYGGIKEIKDIKREMAAINESECKIYLKTPAVCLKMGLPMEEAIHNQPANLTAEDYRYLFIEKGWTKAAISAAYNFKSPPAFYTRLKVLGVYPEPADNNQQVEAPQPADVEQAVEQTDCEGESIEHRVSKALEWLESQKAVSLEEAEAGLHLLAVSKVLEALYSRGIEVHQLPVAVAVVFIVNEIITLADPENKEERAECWAAISKIARGMSV